MEYFIQRSAKGSKSGLRPIWFTMIREFWFADVNHSIFDSDLFWFTLLFFILTLNWLKLRIYVVCLSGTLWGFHILDAIIGKFRPNPDLWRHLGTRLWRLRKNGGWGRNVSAGEPKRWNFDETFWSLLFFIYLWK